MFSNFWSNYSNLNEDTRKSIISKAYSKDTNGVTYLLDSHNIDVNDSTLVDESKNTLLHLAVATKNTSLAKHLIGKKSTLNKKNSFGETPMQIALKNQDEGMVKILLNTSTSTSTSTSTYSADEI
ncbi:MAG: ankyrin repeat domain-containing protein, partial [Nitrososphaeraceae archaeon]|nr:ankyrin repeat domain-containing protein [Nitrososphaeraceae archaeon]